MKITPPSQTPSHLYLSGRGDAKLWKVGELVRAVAISQHSLRKLTLRIGNGQYTAYSKTSVPIGRPLLMRVAHAGAQPVLELLAETPSVRTGDAGAALPGLLSSLLRLSSRPGGVRLSREARLAAQQLMRLLPEPGKLTDNGGLRQLVLNSGSFLEAKLLHALGGALRHSLNEDWKALLLRFRDALQKLIPSEALHAKTAHTRPPLQQKIIESFAEVDASRNPERLLLRQIDAALIKVELNQLSSRATEDPSRQVWLVDLPVKGRQGEPELFSIRIERDVDGSAETGEPAWSFVLQMDVAPLGHLSINVYLHQQRVSVHFVADQAKVSERLRRNFPQLEQGLTQRGLKVGALTGHVGAADTTRPGPPGSLELLA